MNNPALKLNRDRILEFLFLFSNADAFYITARYSLLYGLLAPGCTNAHQAIELYLKAILKLNYEGEKGHNLINILRKYEKRDKYFSKILQNEVFTDFLKELFDAYLILRYGEAGSSSNTGEIIKILDELAFNLRNIYLSNIKYSSGKIFVPKTEKEDFLKMNNFFSEKDITSNPLAQMGLPIDDFLAEVSGISKGEK